MSKVALMSAPIRAPTWVSTRRLFEQKLQNLQKCTNLIHIKEVHAQIIKQNLHQDLYVVPKLISAFSTCHQMDLAVNVFNQIQDPNVHLYNTLIRAQVQNSQSSIAFATFCDMQQNGIFADNFTYPFLLKACNGPTWLPVVQMIHSNVEKSGFFGDLFVPNALIDSYSKCGLLGVNSAMNLFIGMKEKDTVTWNSMISGLVKAGDLSGARKLFDEMPVADTVSWNTILDGYVKAGEMNEAFGLFNRMPERNVVSWSTMVMGYCRAGDMEMARMLFDRMPVKNLVTWTIIISGFAEKGLVKEAVTLYDQMEAIRLRPDDGTLISILAACAETGLLGLGIKIHSSIERIRYKCSVNVSNSLLDMYAKCGRIEKAFTVFSGMSKKDIVSWNCILQGLAMHGHGQRALELFSRMQHEGFNPDKITLIGVLCACTHAGLIDEGLHHFNNMERDYGITPQIEHYGCMIDLLGRGGRLREACLLVQSMPMEPNAVIWGTLLGACRMHNAVGLADKVLNRLETSDPGNYSMLSNIFAAAGDWNSVANMRLQMKGAGVQKPSGASSIELDNEVYDFTVFDKTHPKSDMIYQTINNLRKDMKQVSYVPEIDQ
ncbi:Tetratricopeptide repeat (TPR)-like superfamily protein [Euphorbia peplus]|nr:Tetratricopeptide repeat (TPR)-like superfamily protein [Euphorbia peplus]